MTSPQSHVSIPLLTACVITGWGAAVGTHLVSAERLEHEFKLPAGKISKAAGIESVARVQEGDDEVTLGALAAAAALAQAESIIGRIQCLIATSETHTDFPALAARLHARLRADERCAAFDVGGGCLGLVNGLALAQSFLASGQFHEILLVTADVHSRVLTPAKVKGEFGALFGDGASAFVLRASESESGKHYRVGQINLGCKATAASAIKIGLHKSGAFNLVFQGDALSRAALSQLEEMISGLERNTGIKRSSVAALATHQPNPRLLRTLSRQLGVPLEKFPPVALTCGNLGSSTCAVALVRAIEQSTANGKHDPIFLASLGPGLLFGCTVLS